MLVKAPNSMTRATEVVNESFGSSDVRGTRAISCTPQMFCKWSLSSYNCAWNNSHIDRSRTPSLSARARIARPVLLFAEFLVDKESSWPENL
jgi:hypothetical protein